MSDVVRLFVEKKPGFDVEAKQIKQDIIDNLGIKSITDLRFANRYDISGVDSQDLKVAVDTVFSEPNQDNVFNEMWDTGGEYAVFAIEYLPGQYSQRADSAEQCVRLLKWESKPIVVTARVLALSGNISNGDMDKIKDYMINPVECRLASLNKPETLEMKLAAPDMVETVDGFINMSVDAVKAYWGGMGFAMALDDLIFCRDYFRDGEKRDPTITELKVIDTYWSDHCRHTTFLTRIGEIKIDENETTKAVEDALKLYFDLRGECYAQREKDVSMMDMATIGARTLKKRGLVPDLDESEEINACSIEATVDIDG